MKKMISFVLPLLFTLSASAEIRTNKSTIREMQLLSNDVKAKDDQTREMKEKRLEALAKGRSDSNGD